MSQDSELDVSLFPKATKKTRTIAFTSGKGGVGISVLALNLAILLAELGKKVVVLDGDFGFGNLHILLGCHPRFYTGHVVAGEMRLVDTIFKTHYGVGIIPTDLGAAELANLDEEEVKNLTDQLEEVRAGCDFLFIDTGSGIGWRVFDLIAVADEAFVVMRPEPTSLADSYALIKIFTQDHMPFPFHLLLNMVSSPQHAGQVYDSVAQILFRFLGYQPGCAGFVLNDAVVPRSVINQHPFVLSSPKSQAAVCLRRIADDLLGHRYREELNKSISPNSILKNIIKRVWPRNQKGG